MSTRFNMVRARRRPPWPEPGLVAILEPFISAQRDVSLIWPNREFISSRVRQVTDFFAEALAGRI